MIFPAIDPKADAIGKSIMDAAFRVHRELGPGLLESAYVSCLCYELAKLGLHMKREVMMPVYYDGKSFDIGYRIDILVDDCVVVEVKSVEILKQIHHAQLLTYLKSSGHRLGYLINFNVHLLKDGFKRMVC